MQFHMKIFAEADVIVSPTTGYYTLWFSFPVAVSPLISNVYLYDLSDSVTAYPLKDDALETGELDYINGGVRCLINWVPQILVSA